MIKDQKLTVEDLRKIVDEKVKNFWIPEHTDLGHFYRHKNGTKLYKSVTSFDILKSEQIIMWAVKCGFEWMELDDRFRKLNPQNRDEYLLGSQLAHKSNMIVAGAIGTITHNAAESYLNYWVRHGEKPKSIMDFVDKKVVTDKMTAREIDIIDMSVVSAVKAVENYINHRKNAFPILIELSLGSEEIGVAGTADVFMAIVGDDGYVESVEYWDWKTSNSVRDFYAMQCSVYSKFFTDMTDIEVDKQIIVKLNKYNGKFNDYIVSKPKKAYKFFLKSVEFKKDWIDSTEHKLLPNYNEIIL